MSKACQITGKRAMVGNNVSHSNHKTKRVFNVNLFEKKFYWPEQNLLDPPQGFSRWSSFDQQNRS